MSIRKQLIKLNNKLESTWRHIDLRRAKPDVTKGWFIAEFILKAKLDHVPRILIDDAHGKTQERSLIGSHAG